MILYPEDYGCVVPASDKDTSPTQVLFFGYDIIINCNAGFFILQFCK